MPAAANPSNSCATLRRGASYALRPVCADDIPALQTLVRNLPPADRRYRFHGAVNELPAELLQAMTTIDPARDFALVATDLRTGSVIADARWVRDPEGDDAEFALMVAAGWRRRGIASACVFALRRAAAERGLHRLYGFVLADNMPMRALMQHCGFAVRPDFGDRDRVVAASIVAPAASPSCRAAAGNPPCGCVDAPADLESTAYAGLHGLH
jgi:acetyltransferase